MPAAPSPPAAVFTGPPHSTPRCRLAVFCSYDLRGKMLKAALLAAAAASSVATAPNQPSGITGIRGSLAFAPSVLPLGRSQHTWSVSPAVLPNGLLNHPSPTILQRQATHLPPPPPHALKPSHMYHPLLCNRAGEGSSPRTPAHESVFRDPVWPGPALPLTPSRAKLFSRSRPVDAYPATSTA